MNPVHGQPPSYDDYTAQPPSGSALLEVEDGLTMNQRARAGRGSLIPGLDCLVEHVRAHVGALYVLWFVAFVIACCAMSQANVNKTRIHDIKSSSSSTSSTTTTTDDERPSQYGTWTTRCEFYGELLYGMDVHEYGGHHYQIVGGNWAAITWMDAMQDAWNRCYDSAPGYLASINSAAENEFLQGLLMDDHGFKTEDQAWIGGTDMAEEGVFEWIDGYAASTVFTGPGASTGAYSNWMANEPNNNGNEDCVAFNEHGKWNDDHCYKQKQYFIVEFDA